MPAASVELRELAQDLTQAGQRVEKVAADLIGQIAQQIQAYAQAAAPRDTGKLAGSIHIVWVDRLTAEVKPGVAYGPFQEFGTASRGEFPGKPYEIRPKAKPFLVFQVNGRTVYARKVTHPGVRAQPYMRPAALTALEPFADRLAERGALLITKGPRSAL